jgi:hypothetical protein
MASRLEIGRTTFLALVVAAMLAPSGAESANVLNGNFESGTLSGWRVHRLTAAGNWFSYSGTDAPIGSRRPKPADPVQSPPQGNFAAIADQANPDTLILYQDVALEPRRDHRLSLLAYYDSYDPIAVPNPDTLSVADEALLLPNGKFRRNQQFRIDVVRPEAALESLDPDDVIRTVFATRSGNPLRMTPRRLSADLSAFAGQTVRIRIASVAGEEVFNAGVDAVSIATSAPGQGGFRGGRRRPTLFKFGRLAAKRRKGSATLQVRVSGPGLLRVKGALMTRARAAASATAKLRKPIEPVTLPIATAKTVTIHLRPTPAALAVLRRQHRLPVKLEATFMPFGGVPETATLPIRLRLAN